MQQLTLDTMPGWQYNLAPKERNTEIDLCSLLNGLKVSTDKETANAIHEIQMSDDLNIPIYTPSTCPTSHISNSTGETEEEQGCPYLQSIRAQIDHFGSTDGEYLQTIFTHREIVSAFPPAHSRCARALSDIAYVLEKYAWSENRRPDIEAVTAFRHEAWSIAAAL